MRLSSRTPRIAAASRATPPDHCSCLRDRDLALLTQVKSTYRGSAWKAPLNAAGRAFDALQSKSPDAPDVRSQTILPSVRTMSTLSLGGRSPACFCESQYVSS